MRVFVCRRTPEHLADALRRIDEVGEGDSSESETRYQLDTDLTAYLICAQEAAKRMSAGSDIVFIGSMSAVSRGAGGSIYVAAKSRIQSFVPSFRKELAEEEDIKVGLIEPGFTGADFQYPSSRPRGSASSSTWTRCFAPRTSRWQSTAC